MSYVRLVIAGGNWNNGGYTGPRCRNFNNASSNSNANNGGRRLRCIKGSNPLSTTELIALSVTAKYTTNRRRKPKGNRLFVSKVIENKRLFK